MMPFPDTAAFIRVLEATSERNGGKRISKIWLKAGNEVCFRGNTAAYLEDILKGTAARGADIYISRGSTAGRCRCCGLIYGNEKEEKCPACGGSGESIPLDKSFIVDMVEIQE
ncbi:MAG TPA: hydrogenase/urease maturation nickel metallochaperone HypA [Clostridia bacterium]|nr:hydrogenase/urease maturation nickel metallochaperone HypA [Clostridia bacterium]